VAREKEGAYGGFYRNEHYQVSQDAAAVTIPERKSQSLVYIGSFQDGVIRMKMCNEHVPWVQLQVLSLASIEQNEAVHEDARVSGISPRSAFNVSSRPKNRNEHEKFRAYLWRRYFSRILRTDSSGLCQRRTISKRQGETSSQRLWMLAFRTVLPRPCPTFKKFRACRASTRRHPAQLQGRRRQPFPVRRMSNRPSATVSHEAH
jgi:hypothetical protein